MTERKTGPLTHADFLALWTSVVPDTYSRPFVELGEGSGFEAFTQAWAQHARVSEAVDRTMGSLFVDAWSGQTSAPASGAALAQVDLAVTRAAPFDDLLILAPSVFIEEEQTDFAPGGGELVGTGRRYHLDAPLVFLPGVPGPLVASAHAEFPGYGFNNPLPGTLRRVDQPGSRFTNNRASLVPGIEANRLEVRPEPDVVIPDHVGQYVELLAGANAGRRLRVIGYDEPTVDTNPPTGGTLLLAPTMVLRISLIAGTFQPGEIVEQASTGARIRVLIQSGTHLYADRLENTFALGALAAGVRSGAVAVFDALELSPDILPESGTAVWRILDWATDLGLTVANGASPAGGASATLDEAGDDRGIQRRAGETGPRGDASYRRRVGALADVVSPNALTRTANRMLAPYGESAVLREVGLPLFRGLLFDGDPSSDDPAVAYAFDLDMLAVSGSITGAFLEGEEVRQNVGGIIASGTALLAWAPAAQGAPENTPTFAGIGRIRGDFVNGQPIVGMTSGATIANPTFTGGLVERDRFKLNLDFTEFRAFFLMGVRSTGLGEFGIAFDVGPNNAFDADPYLAFFDGFPLTEAAMRRGIWNGLNEAKAGGVGFSLVLEH